ncbi:MAG: phenylacetate--CoA ligase family protein [Deltaproteobacteria bacterium]|nr:MAG: phenylacetate--CoA ligase family protein [Deltaproteobacteria bacterium]
MKMIYSLKDIVQNAFEKSPYYRNLYEGCDLSNFESLPLINQEDFWKANTYHDNKLLTGPITNGVVFKSGGTTGNPKFSAFTKTEWETFTHEFGDGMAFNGLKEGDRVGNLFYSGDLYASFLFITKSLELCPVPCTHFPMTGAMEMSEVVKTIEEYNINVLAGVPTSFINLSQYLFENNKTLKLDTVLFGGESLYEDQIGILSKAFPGAKINSVGYASVDGGHLGFFTDKCSNGEHEVFLESCLMELIDEETGEVINELGRAGKLVYTNLTRMLMPIIRYPVGDRAEWVEMTSEGLGKRFMLRGRSEEGARIGPVTVNADDLHNIFHENDLADKINNFQFVMDRETHKDRLTVNIVAVPGVQLSESALQELFYKERPMFKEAVEENLIADIEFKLVETNQLVRNKRTGKLRLVVDLR